MVIFQPYVDYNLPFKWFETHFFQARCPSWCTANNVNATKAKQLYNWGKFSRCETNENR